MGSVLNPVNSTIIATALVPIATDLHVSVGTIAVLVSALYLVSAVAHKTTFSPGAAHPSKHPARPRVLSTKTGDPVGLDQLLRPGFDHFYSEVGISGKDLGDRDSRNASADDYNVVLMNGPDA